MVCISSCEKATVAGREVLGLLEACAAWRDLLVPERWPASSSTTRNISWIVVVPTLVDAEVVLKRMIGGGNFPGKLDLKDSS